MVFYSCYPRQFIRPALDHSDNDCIGGGSMAGKINSKTKGKVGELEAAALLKEYGFEARRGQQFSGGGDSPDVVHNIPNVHIEVKRRETLSLYKAMEQAKGECGSKVPVILHRRNGKEWLAILPASDLLRAMRTLKHFENRATTQHSTGRNNGQD